MRGFILFVAITSCALVDITANRNVKCSTTATELNVTWKNMIKGTFKNDTRGYKVVVRRNKERVEVKNLNSSSHHYFLNRLVPFSSYKVTVRAGRRVGYVVCRTKEGVPTRVQNLTVSAQSESSLLVEWSPPAQINGRLLGYNLTVIKQGSILRVIPVKYSVRYLLTNLTSNTMYKIQVFSYTAEGRSPSAHVTGIGARTKAARAIEFPQSHSGNTLEVTWTTFNNLEEEETCDVEHCTGSQCRNFKGNSSLVVNNLSQYTTHLVKVRGRKVSAGPWKVTVRLTPPVCSGEELCQLEVLKNIQWTTTFKGERITRPCPRGFGGKATRTCSKEKAVWDKPDLSKCVSERFTRHLDEVMKAETINSTTAVSLAEKLKKITDPASPVVQFSGNLFAAVTILTTLGNKTAKNPPMNEEESKQFMKTVIHVADNLLDGGLIDVWLESPQESRVTKATDLMVSIEKIALMTAAVSNSTKTISIDTTNVVLKFRSVQRHALAEEAVSFSAGKKGLESGIYLPASVVQKRQAESFHVAFVYMKNVGRLLGNSLPRSFNLNSSTNNETHIVERGIPNAHASPNLISLSTNDNETDNFTEPVKIIVQIFKNNSLKPWCVFWKGDAGVWSSEGCLVHSSNYTHTVCHCNHLTSFSVLMQFTEDSHAIKASDKEALSLITYVGISISLVALVIAFVTFCSLGFLNSNRNFAHINLALSLILAELLFVLGIDKTQNQTACFVIAVCLHYLFLVSFAWMATEGVILYLMLVKVFPTASKGPKRRLLFICSWGIPTIPVATAILVHKEGYTTETHCWLSIADGMIWSFVGPVLMVCLVNIYFLGRTFKVMADRTSNQPARNPPGFRYWIKACAVLTCLLGTTWLLGMFFVDKETVVMAYLFNIFNVLQGLLIFIFHCLADERIRAEYKRVLCCHGSRRDHLRNLRNESGGKMTPTKHSQTTLSSRLADKKIQLKGKIIGSCEDETAVVTHDSGFQIAFGEDDSIQNTDSYVEIPSASAKIKQVEDEAEITSAWDTSEFEDYGNNDDSNSVDMFFEDISSSLMCIPADKTSMFSKQESLISSSDC
ncbi:adhesion G protein-coupled receptor L4-like isoform X1 [Acropora muricata]|uniref:adhesion G protein-coupled receptor L4-like isoform X1 n=2 Tax=Acropora muricata TaxID=159855 RepID=UPI0034E57E00